MFRTASGRISRPAACAMAFMVLVIVLLSAFCLAEETGHHCTGEDCRVCAVIRVCQTTLRSFCHVLPAVRFMAPSLFAVPAALCGRFLFPASTPVSRKVQLNN